MSRIALIDCGSGNLYAVQRALEKVSAGAHVFQCYDVNQLERTDKVMLTGSGQLDTYVDELHRLLFIDALCEFARSHPVLASNLGMLALGVTTSKAGNKGLGLLDGSPRNFYGAAPRVPHIGWNDVSFVNDHWLFSGFNQHLTGYFTHGQYLQPDGGDKVLAETEHGNRFASVVCNGNVVGVQFLPENSSKQGLQFLANFISWETA
ncbi:MAG: imidazole glycerol phosphate synthase subunit HisH [Gammaproteobacteria bacterium]